MRIFITGATGFIGSALSARLRAAGHQITAWVRNESKARGLLGPEVTLASAPASIRDAIAKADAVINLAGEPVSAGRWTATRKQTIVESRVKLTKAIASAITELPSRPAVFISASAVGYYGDGGGQIVEDDAAPGNDFLARVCRNWEAAALEAGKSGVRVFIPRIGIVLGADGGALASMVTPFRLGVGGPLGSGRQYVPWIHFDDQLAIIIAALEDRRMSGPMISAAPNPVTSRELAKAIGAVLHRASFMPVPAIALRILLGEAATMMLSGQRVRPRRLEQLGFSWRYPTIAAALTNLLSHSRG
jgi:uncharacterized protein (TIGR01777 family)